MEPEEVAKLFETTSNHMNKDAMMLLSWATILNNASLRNANGALDFKKSYARTPITKRSESTDTRMTFLDRKDIVAMAGKAGLQPYAFDQLDNPYFPTRAGKLQYPLSSKLGT